MIKNHIGNKPLLKLELFVTQHNLEHFKVSFQGGMP